MHLVAIARPGNEAELAGLAADLGTTLYELRLTLAAGYPAVVLATVDDARAALAESALWRRGFRAIACARAEVTPSPEMTALSDFELGAEGLVASRGAGDRLAYDDISVLLRATHRTAKTSTSEVKERKLRPGMAIATGGLIMSKTTRREVVTQTVEHEQVLYLFRQSGPAWILRERGARYVGLGAELRPTSLENFVTTTRKLRERAPGARYDERLMHPRPIRGVADGIDATDILAHLIAKDLGS
jgi:hypothetical protein